MNSPAVLIIDDDPAHLRIYGWIIQAAGFSSVPALVSRDQIELPSAPVDLVLLDYHLNGIEAADVAQRVRERFSAVPILVLSDALMLPDDVAPRVDGFIRKGDPARLVETVSRVLGRNSATGQHRQPFQG